MSDWVQWQSKKGRNLKLCKCRRIQSIGKILLSLEHKFKLLHSLLTDIAIHLDSFKGELDNLWNRGSSSQDQKQQIPSTQDYNGREPSLSWLLGELPQGIPLITLWYIMWNCYVMFKLHYLYHRCFMYVLLRKLQMFYQLFTVMYSTANCPESCRVGGILLNKL